MQMTRLVSISMTALLSYGCAVNPAHIAELDESMVKIEITGFPREECPGCLDATPFAEIERQANRGCAEFGKTAKFLSRRLCAESEALLLGRSCKTSEFVFMCKAD